MTIPELAAALALTANDLLAIYDAEAASNEPTKKITAQNLAAAIKTLASLLGTGDVINNLTSTATDKPLSANMGKALNDKIMTWDSISLTATIGSAYGFINKAIKLAVIVFNAGTSSGDGTITMNGVTSRRQVYGALRGGGYLRTNGNSDTVNIVSSTQYGVGQVVFDVATIS